LFETDLIDYLCEIDDRAGKLHMYDAELDGIPVGDERNAKVEKKMAEIKWLTEQLGELPKRFSPYLKFNRK